MLKVCGIIIENDVFYKRESEYAVLSQIHKNAS